MSIANHLYLILSILFAVSSQLIIKWQMSAFDYDNLGSFNEKFLFAFSMILKPYVLLAIFLTFMSGISWMIAMTKFELSYAYPFTFLGLMLITFFSAILFNESLNFYKLFGILFISFGIYIVSKGY